MKSAVATPVKEALGRLTNHQQKILAGENKVSPGEPATFTRGCVPGCDMICQGDLDLLLEEGVPTGFVPRKNRLDGQLVPGTTVGSKHVVRDPSTCQIFDPPRWSPEYDELAGPVVVAEKDTVIDHPTHGAVTVLAGQTVHCEYQRVWEQEQARERRQRD
jgi:hypothetical protein